jgi:hypothetical protein
MKKIPSQLIVLVAAITLAQFLGLPKKDGEGHELDTVKYSMMGQTFELSPKTHLVNVPARIQDGVAYPEFSALKR